MWQYRGQVRPPVAEDTAEHEESVWDYPWPPVSVVEARRIQVFAGRRLLADSSQSLRLLETASLPPEDVALELLSRVSIDSVCESKGTPVYWAVRDHGGLCPVAWTYPEPREAYAELADCFGFLTPSPQVLSRLKMFVRNQAVFTPVG